MKICLMFSGQGAQYQGMGQSLVETYPVCRAVYQESETISGIDIQEISFNDMNRLNQTKYTQVCMYTMYAAIIALLDAYQIKTSISMGLSLGEYGAYLHQGVFDFKTGLKIIQKRAELMQKAAEEKPGKMAAVIGLDGIILEEILHQQAGDVSIANYNAPSQLVISGQDQAVDHVAEIIKRDYKKRVIPLKTSGAFHSEYMRSAKEGFKSFLEGIDIHEPQGLLYLNTSGAPYDGHMKTHMANQLTHSVRFYQMVHGLEKDGVDLFIEIGPKKTLCQLLRKINPDLMTMHVEDVSSFQELLQYLEVNK